MSDSDSDDVMGELLGLNSSNRKTDKPSGKPSGKPRHTTQHMDSRSPTPKKKTNIYQKLDDIDFDIGFPESFEKLRDLPPDMDDGLLDQINEEEELKELLQKDRLSSINHAEKQQAEEENISSKVLNDPKNKNYLNYLKGNADRLKDFYFIEKPVTEVVPMGEFDNRMSKLTAISHSFENGTMSLKNVDMETIYSYVRKLGGSSDLLERKTRPSEHLKLGCMDPTLPMIITVAQFEVLVAAIATSKTEDYSGAHYEIFKLMVYIIELFLLDARVTKPYLSDRIGARSGNPSSVELLNGCLTKLTIWRYQDQSVSQGDFKGFCELLRSGIPRDEPDLVYRLISNISDGTIPFIKYAVYWLCLDSIVTLNDYDEYDGNDDEIKQKTAQLITYEIDLENETNTLETIVHSLLLFLNVWSNSVLGTSAESGKKPLHYAKLRIRLIERLVYAIIPNFTKFEKVTDELRHSHTGAVGESSIFEPEEIQPREAIFSKFKSSLVSLTKEYFINYGGSNSSDPIHGDCLLVLAAVEHKLDRSITKASVF
ncbi:unnamed protein product [Kuraishia capsulata CBS 1993]|uniref:Uncharacterized protein n=1 Tax=Kuraishia capsulata CBS 1993 TaxID=1382522 RepID=W6MRD7_9ASCO|nr:uncharacterized protein KUCA_T00005294001 [Kuraishia capsulata CBS 1993]CDK29306.1 unnamed protein product [Kuraishia capsulata CBS 1993]